MNNLEVKIELLRRDQGPLALTDEQCYIASVAVVLTEVVDVMHGHRLGASEAHQKLAELWQRMLANPAENDVSDWRKMRRGFYTTNALTAIGVMLDSPTEFETMGWWHFFRPFKFDHAN